MNFVSSCSREVYRCNFCRDKICLYLDNMRIDVSNSSLKKFLPKGYDISIRLFQYIVIL